MERKTDRRLSSSKATHELTLDEAIDLIAYGAHCDRCHETRRIDLAKLRERLGSQVRVGEIRPRLQCAKCGYRRIVVVTLWLSASSTPSLSADWK